VHAHDDVSYCERLRMTGHAFERLFGGPPASPKRRSRSARWISHDPSRGAIRWHVDPTCRPGTPGVRSVSRSQSGIGTLRSPACPLRHWARGHRRWCRPKTSERPSGVLRRACAVRTSAPHFTNEEIETYLSSRNAPHVRHPRVALAAVVADGERNSRSTESHAPHARACGAV